MPGIWPVSNHNRGQALQPGACQFESVSAHHSQLHQALHVPTECCCPDGHLLDSASLPGAKKLLTSPALSHPLLKPWGLPFVSFQPPLFKNALWSLKLSSSYSFLKFPCYYYTAHPSAQPWDLWLLSLSTFSLEQLQWQLSDWPWCLERESEVTP